MRLIDGDTLLEQFRTLRDNWDTKNATHRAVRGAFVDCILRTKDAPTIDAEPMKRAYWECGWICSNCRYCNGERGTDYCPYCGAKMDGDSNDKSG